MEKIVERVYFYELINICAYIGHFKDWISNTDECANAMYILQ